jgi:PAS domain S-box-containing protein
LEKENSFKFDKLDHVFKLLFDLSVQGIFIEDERGNILACNKAGHKMFGYPEGELIGKSIADLVPEEFARELPEIIPDEMATGDQYVERINKRKDGSFFSTEICTKFTSIEGKRCLIAYIHDISQQKKQQEELIQSKNELEATVESKNTLISVLAHDLKNPLHAIMGLSDILKKQKNELKTEDIFPIINEIHASSSNGLNLLENLTQWALARQKQISAQFTPVSVKKLLKQLLTETINQAERKDINLDIEKNNNVFVHADHKMLSFILRNLVSNAIKFSYPGNTVQLSIESTGDKLCFEIYDFGTGMSEEEAKKIMNFRRIENQKGTANENGSGFGLMLCNEFIRLMNSKLHIETAPGKGSKFSFCLQKA